MRTVDWINEQIVIIDQTVLPHEFSHLTLSTADHVVDAIRQLAVRGAPAIGATGALGIALLARTAQEAGAPIESILENAERIAEARPTAVNLRWAVDHVLLSLPEGYDAVVDSAVALMQADVTTNEAMARRGADFVETLSAPNAEISILTHCNTGDLATVEGGTALGVAFELHARGHLREVIANETRPLLQGARLTAFELDQREIPYRISADSAGASCIARGLVDVVLIGADSVAANGDTANKIGSYPLALACRRAGIPFVVVAPESTIDLATPTGADIKIEIRADREVTHIGEVQLVPAGARAINFAFDVTPADLITAIVSERRIIRPASAQQIEPWDA